MAASLGSNYRRLWSSSGLSNLADGVAVVAMPLLALQLTRAPVAIAAVTLAGRLPWLLFALHAGALADRLDRRRVMVSVNLARAVILGALAALVAADLASLAALVATAFALGTAETLFDTSAQSIMPSIVARDDLSRGNGRLYAVELTANQFVGPPLGGVLAAVSIGLAFAGSALAYGVAAVVLALLVGSFRPARTGPRTTLRADVAEGLRYLWRHRVLRTLGAMVGVMNLASTAVFAVFPLYAVAPGPLGLSEARFGFLLTASAVGSLAASFVAERTERTVGRARLLAGCVALSGLSYLAMALWSHLAVVAAAFAVTGVAAVLWNVVTVSLRQRIVPDHLLGRVNAGYRLLAWGTMPIGAALGGVLAEYFGLRAVFAAAGVAIIVLLVGSLVVTDEAMTAAETGPSEEPRAAAV